MNKKRMYGMIYRARRKGSEIATRQRTIYRAYTREKPPPHATGTGVGAGIWLRNTITN